MRRQFSALFMLALLAACDGAASEPSGPPALRVIAGDGQHATAALADSLISPVTARLYRTQGGGITLRLGDLVAKPLHAQTNVRGIPNAQVCAVGIGAVRLVPWNPCAISDSDGRATFWFEPGTTAGVAMAEIRAVVDGFPVVTDTVTAVIQAGPVATWTVAPTLSLSTGDSVTVSSLVSNARDQHGNPVATPAINAIATGGFVQRGGYLVAPGAEAGGELTLSSGTATATVTVSALADLKASRWRLSWACYDSGRGEPHADSLLYVMTVDSVGYRGQQEGEGRPVTFYGEQSAVAWMTGMPRDSTTFRHFEQQAMQRPGKLVWPPLSASGEAVATEWGYQGGDMCARIYLFASTAPVKVERLP